MELILTPEQSMQYEEGGWAQWRLEETLVEDLERANITEPVTVHLDNGHFCFAIDKK